MDLVVLGARGMGSWKRCAHAGTSSCWFHAGLAPGVRRRGGGSDWRGSTTHAFGPQHGTARACGAWAGWLNRHLAVLGVRWPACHGLSQACAAQRNAVSSCCGPCPGAQRATLAQHCLICVSTTEQSVPCRLPCPRRAIMSFAGLGSMPGSCLQHAAHATVVNQPTPRLSPAFAAPSCLLWAWAACRTMWCTTQRRPSLW